MVSLISLITPIYSDTQATIPCTQHYAAKRTKSVLTKKIKNLITFRSKGIIRLPVELIAARNTKSSDRNNKKFQRCLSKLKIKMNSCGENERLIQKVH
jgi:hypothetical protein